MRPGLAADHSPPFSATAHPLGHTGPVTGKLYLFIRTKKKKKKSRILSL